MTNFIRKLLAAPSDHRPMTRIVGLTLCVMAWPMTLLFVLDDISNGFL